MEIIKKFTCISTWLYSAILFGGCSPDTLVATPSQLNIARALHLHDVVLCRTGQGTTSARPIEMIRRRCVDEVVHLELGDDELDVAPDQRFLMADNLHYITADQLTTDHQLVNIRGNPVTINHLERRYGTYSLITWSVHEFLHNNIAPSLTATSQSWATPAKMALAGAGIISIPLTTPAAGAMIASGCIYVARDTIISTCRAIGRGFAWLFGINTSIGQEVRELLKHRESIKYALHEISQMADPEPNDGGTYLLYEPSPKHYPHPWGNASPGPGWIEGQIALNLSWPVAADSGCTDTRVAYCKGKIVIFQFTQQVGKF